MKIDNLYIPGKEEYDFREFRYVNIRKGDGKINKDNFVNILASANIPLIPTNGGVLNENFIIVTPDERRFYGFSYSKDIIGWREQIEKGASILNLDIAQIRNGEYLTFKNGEKFRLQDCLFERYNFYDDSGNLIKKNTPVDKDKVL